jgi:hypothetical protein
MDRTSVVKESWDYLIILDACRYDYFERVHEKYVRGRLSKKISPGSCTNDWLAGTFEGYHDDIVYISSNPQISSKSRAYGFLGGEHFCRVYDVWRDGWDKAKGTVRPETVTQAAIDILSKNNIEGKRVIIHYMQPHAPYLSLGKKSYGYLHAEINAPRTLVGADKSVRDGKIKKVLFRLLMGVFKNGRIFGNHPDWVLRRFLRMSPRAPMEGALRNCSIQQLRQAYQSNLESVLEQVAVLLKYLKGRIVITSDHGDFLGEGRCFSHPADSSEPVLREVPWLVIEKDTSENALHESEHKADDQESDKGAGDTVENEQAMFAERLSALGYYD